MDDRESAGVAVALARRAGVAAWLAKPAAAPRPRHCGDSRSRLATDVRATTNRDIAITPDGFDDRLHRRASAANGSVYVRRLDALTATPLRQAEALTNPLSPRTAQWVAFNDETDYTMRKLALTGGPPVTVAKIGREMLGATWGADDSIIYATDEGLWRIPPAGGTPESLARPDQAKGESLVGLARIPARRSVPCSTRSRWAVRRTTTLAVRRCHSADRSTAALSKVLLRGATNPRYAASGHLLYVAEGSLRAVAFDPDRLEVRGEAVPIASGLVTKVSGGANVGGRGGWHARLRRGRGGRDRTAARLDRSRGVGGRRGATPLRAYGSVRVSPDGKRVAHGHARSARSDIYLWDIAPATLGKIHE